jgi:N-acetylmuramoyl-L-alanine amidase
MPSTARPIGIACRVAAVLSLVALTAACTTSTKSAASSARPTISQSTSSGVEPSFDSTTPELTPTPTETTPSPTPTPTRAPAPAPAVTPIARVSVPATNGPVIVIDPGHSPTISSTDPNTGLNDSDYENEPEMRDVFAVAQLVRSQLLADGYQVVMTKSGVTTRISLGQRAAVANKAHAALAVSIHDEAGSNGGIQFSQGNNVVYYQSVGDYRETPTGKKVVFTNTAVAATSTKFGQVFQTQRAAAEGHSVRLQGNVGYDLGSRGLPAGNIWMVQLLSNVPWIYNEAGGNSAGMSGLNATDKQRYANGLVASIEHCVPIVK